MSGRKPVMAYTKPEWINRVGVLLRAWPKRKGNADGGTNKAKALLKRMRM